MIWSYIQLLLLLLQLKSEFLRGTTSLNRRSCQTVLAEHLISIVSVIAPILPHLAEDVWQNLPFEYATEDGSAAKFAFELKWPVPNKRWLQIPADDVDFWRLILELRSEVNKILENARVGKLIGSSLEAKVYLHSSDAGVASRLRELCLTENEADALHRIFITSQVAVLDSLNTDLSSRMPHTGKFSDPRSEIWIGVARADGTKCERCWNFTPQVGSFPEHPTLCARCYDVINVHPLPAAAGVS